MTPRSNAAPPDSPPQRTRGTHWVVLVLLAGLAFPMVALWGAVTTNGRLGLPLDDPWIHLNYARNLAETGRFTYFPGDPSSAGSSAPLYTLLLAAGFLLTTNGVVLGLVIGLSFHAAFLITLWSWACRRFADRTWALALTLIVALDPRIGSLAVSGMETSLALWLLSMALWGAAAGRRWVMGVAAGSLVWVRPEGLVLVGVIAIWDLLQRWWLRPAANRSATPRLGALRGWWIPTLALIGGYLLFNAAVGDALLPNTVAAKQAYYAGAWWGFVSGDLRRALLSGSFWLLTPCALIAALRSARRLLHRAPPPFPLELGWGIGLVSAACWLLPYAHRFDRYLVPLLPVIALVGLDQLAAWRGRARSDQHRSWWSATLLGVLIAAQLPTLPAAAGRYVEFCRYHQVRHERCGQWLADHTPPDAVIATHDVGAIAYFSHRRVIDALGLIQPDATPQLGTERYTAFLERFFAERQVTHLAALRNWLEVTNVRPIFQAEPTPELLEVFPWVPGRTHLHSEPVRRLIAEAVELLARDPRSARQAARRAVALDPRSGTAHFVLGAAEALAGEPTAAEQQTRTGLTLFPDSEQGLTQLVALLIERRASDELPIWLERLAVVAPNHPLLQAAQPLLAR